MKIATQNQNRQNQTAFGLNYTRAFRNSLISNAHALGETPEALDISRQAIINLGQLRKRADGLVIDKISQGLMDGTYIRNTKNKFTGLMSKFENWFLNRNPEKTRAFKEKVKLELKSFIALDEKAMTEPNPRKQTKSDLAWRREVLQELESTGNLSPYYISDFLRDETKGSAVKQLALTAEYLSSPQFVTDSKTALAQSPLSKEDILKRMAKAQEYIPIGNPPPQPKPTKLEVLTDKVSAFLSNKSEQLSDWFMAHPYMFKLTKEERARAREIQKLIKGNLT